MANTNHENMNNHSSSDWTLLSFDRFEYHIRNALLGSIFASLVMLLLSLFFNFSQGLDTALIVTGAIAGFIIGKIAIKKS